MNAKTTALLMVGVTLSALWISPAAGDEALNLAVCPPKLEIGTFFAGRNIELSATTEADLDVVFEVFGPQEGARFNLKGRVGPIWMNRAKVELERAPYLYLLLLPEGDKWTSGLAEMGLGFEHMEKSITVRPAGLDEDMIFDQFVKLKRSEELYGQIQGAVQRAVSDSGEKRFQATLFLPSSTEPGVYRVVATGLDGSEVVSRSSLAFQVEETGVIRTIHDLAVDHGLAYGVLSVLIALAVGGVTGVFFRRAGAH